MKIKTITGQSRRDFYAIYECEHCGHTHKGSGYDDDNFHRNVIPNMKCDICSEKAPTTYEPVTPKYSSGTII